MAEEVRISSDHLPAISAEEAGSAMTLMGGVLFNLILYHTGHFGAARRQAAVTNAHCFVASCTPIPT
jgi:hypothetical protein